MYLWRGFPIVCYDVGTFVQFDVGGARYSSATYFFPANVVTSGVNK